MQSTDLMDAIVPEIYEAAAGHGGWAAPLTALARWLRVTRVDLLGMSVGDGAIAFRHSANEHRLDGTLSGTSGDGLSVAPDPYVAAVQSARPGQRWTGLPLDREFLVHGEGRYYAGMPVLGDDRTTVSMILIIDDSAYPLTGERLERLTVARTQIRRALRLAARVARREAESQLRKQIVDVLDYPMFLLDRERRMIDSNTAAAEVMHKGVLRIDTAGCLAMALPVDHEAFAEAFERLLGELRVIPLGSVTVRLQAAFDECPLAAILVGIGDPGQPSVLLILQAIGGPVRVDHGFLASTFGLTQAEARVASLLLEGHTPRAMAESTFVSMTTIRSHLKSLFAKMACRRQADLVRLVAGLPQLRAQPIDALRRRGSVAAVRKRRPATLIKPR